MRRYLSLFIFSALLFPISASALRVSGTTVLIPIIGRFPGANSTQWRTDVFISSHYSPGTTVNMTFYAVGGAPITKSVTLAPFSSVALRDVVLNTFNLSNAAGQLTLTSPSSIQLEARARIYNSGNPAGEFGQNAPGLGLDELSRQAFLYGLSGVNGNRVNAGVANPNDAAISVNITVTDKNNNILYINSVTVQPHETRQFNDIFTAFGITPQADVQVNFDTSELTLFGYASEVRNDTGDAVFVVGSSPNS